MLVAALTTWLLVSTMPSEVSTMPVPAPVDVRRSTTAGSTHAAIDDTLIAAVLAPGPPAFVDPVADGEVPGWSTASAIAAPPAPAAQSSTAAAATRSAVRPRLPRGGAATAVAA